MSPYSPLLIFVWVIIPAVHFATWYFISVSNPAVNSGLCVENQDILASAETVPTQTLLPALPCDNTELEHESTFREADIYEKKQGVLGYRGCHPVVHPEFETPNVQEVLTADFDYYRAARLAPMTELKGRNANSL